MGIDAGSSEGAEVVVEQAPERRLLLGVLALVRRQRADGDREQCAEPGEQSELLPQDELYRQAALSISARSGRQSKLTLCNASIAF